jgi:hypothetical protein
MSHAAAPPCVRCQLCGSTGATYHPAGAAAGLELACERCWRWAGVYGVGHVDSASPPVDDKQQQASSSSAATAGHSGHSAAPMSTAAAIALWALWAIGLVVVTALAWLAGVATRG